MVFGGDKMKEVWTKEGKDGSCFRGQDLSWAQGEGSSFDGADFQDSCLRNTRFRECTFRNADFRNADLSGADFRGCDLSGADLRGTDIRLSVLEGAVLSGIKTDEKTEGWEMCCPKTGAFVAYKKCVYDRIVQLLVPADAKRSSATGRTCRCDKAKVLTIRSIDCQKEYEEAWSLVDENFVYRKGMWVYADSFTEDRFRDSTHGIHFWMTREEAIKY